MLRFTTEGKANQIVPFKKKRTQDFNEEIDYSALFKQYFVLTKQVENAIADLEKAIADVTG